MNDECDGTTQRGSYNCGRPAVWDVKLKEDPWLFADQACTLHLSQVGTTLLQGEQGELDVRRIKTDE